LLVLTFKSEATPTEREEEESQLPALLHVAACFVGAQRQPIIGLQCANQLRQLQLERDRLERSHKAMLPGNGPPAIQGTTSNPAVGQRLISTIKKCLRAAKYRSGGLFQDAVDSALQYVFPAELANCRREQAVLGGLGRIDLVYRNTAQSGLFYDLANRCRIACPYIHVECKHCKNSKVSNPEIDQLRGRFCDARGHFGFLICAEVDHKNRSRLVW